MNSTFPHRQSAHCESGVTANLLTHHGLPLSEAMAFGLGSGLFFGYLPFIKVNFLPLTTFRTVPGSIFTKATRRLGVRVVSRTFRSEQQGMAELDRHLAEGTPVGAQTGVYWLPYFPPAFRFHFNAHNVVVYGKSGDSYMISDPVFGAPVECATEDLARARFARGALAPKGKIYCISRVPSSIDLAPAAIDAIKEVCRMMVKVPLPILGVGGIRFLAGQMEQWPKRLGREKALLYLGNVIRMQEEIGTGGAGFRFIYAAFLQEVADLLNDKRFLDVSTRLTSVGDRWREFAVAGARHCRGRERENETFADLAAILRVCAAEEKVLFQELDVIVRSVSGRKGR